MNAFAAWPVASFRAFRVLLGRIFREAGLPERVLYDTEDLDSCGGDVAAALWATWRNLEAEARDGEAWPDVAFSYVHDLVIDLGGTPAAASAAGEKARSAPAG